MIAQAFRRALRADSDMFDAGPLPSAGMASWLSGGPSMGISSFPLVASRGDPIWTTFRNVYLTNPWVFAAVSIIANSVARAPLGVFAKNDDGDPERVFYDWPVTPGRPTGAQVLDGLLRFPAGGISRQAMVRATLVDRLVQGNGLWEILPGSPTPSGLQRIRWRALRNVVEGTDGLPLIYEIADTQSSQAWTGRTRKLSPIDVVHFGRGSDPDLPVAISPLASCRDTLRLHNAINRSLVAHFQNGMRLSGQIKVEKLTREKAREIREMVVEAYASPENAGKLLVTDGDWQPTSQPLNSSEIVELMESSRVEVAAAYQIPPPVIGILDKAIKANVYELRSQHLRDTVGMWASDFAGDLEAQLLPAAGSWRGLDIRPDMFAQLLPDLEALAISLNDLESTLTVDDRRRYLGEKPLRIKGVTDVPWSKPGAAPMTDEPNQNPPAAAQPSSRDLRRRRNGTRDTEEVY